MTAIKLLSVIACALTVLAPPLAWAQPKSKQVAESFPSRPIRMIAPFPAGGPTDLVARTIARRLSDSWGQQVIVDNRGGANGVIAQEIAANSAPDGHTMFVHSVAHVVNPLIYKVPYDNERDFVPVTLVVAFPLMLTIHPAVAANSVKDLIALAKSQPGKLDYSSYGQGSIAQLAAEMFKNTAGIDIVHVVYKGAPQGLAAVIANEVQLSFPSVATGLPQVKAGRLKGLAVTSRARAPLMPETPTMIEAGVPDFEATSWFGMFYPRGTPQPLVARLHADTMKLVRTPDVQQTLATQAFEIVGLGPDEFPQFIRSETKKYRQVVKLAKIRVE